MKMKYNLLKNASNVLYLRMKYNSGASAGRNLGLSFVKTPYFLIVDDDFYFHKETNLEYVSSYNYRHPIQHYHEALSYEVAVTS